MTGGLELRIVDSLGIPEGALVSVRVGDMRRQANLGADRAYRFAGVDGKQQMKVDIYVPIAHARLMVEAREARCSVPLEPPASAFSSIGEEEERSSMNIDFEIYPLERSSKEVEADQIDVQKKARQRQVALAAQPYFEEHSLINVMQSLLQAVIKEKPAEPYGYMIKLLENSRAVAAAGNLCKSRPQSALARIGGSTHAAAALPPQKSRPQTAHPSRGGGARGGGGASGFGAGGPPVPLAAAGGRRGGAHVGAHHDRNAEDSGVAADWQGSERMPESRRTSGAAEPGRKTSKDTAASATRQAFAQLDEDDEAVYYEDTSVLPREETEKFDAPHAAVGSARNAVRAAAASNREGRLRLEAEKEANEGAQLQAQQEEQARLAEEQRLLKQEAEERLKAEAAGSRAPHDRKLAEDEPLPLDPELIEKERLRIRAEFKQLMERKCLLVKEEQELRLKAEAAAAQGAQDRKMAEAERMEKERLQSEVEREKRERLAEEQHLLLQQEAEELRLRAEAAAHQEELLRLAAEEEEKERLRLQAEQEAEERWLAEAPPQEGKPCHESCASSSLPVEPVPAAKAAPEAQALYEQNVELDVEGPRLVAEMSLIDIDEDKARVDAAMEELDREDVDLRSVQAIEADPRPPPVMTPSPTPPLEPPPALAPEGPAAVEAAEADADEVSKEDIRRRVGAALEAAYTSGRLQAAFGNLPVAPATREDQCVETMDVLDVREKVRIALQEGYANGRLQEALQLTMAKETKAPTDHPPLVVELTEEMDHLRKRLLNSLSDAAENGTLRGLIDKAEAIVRAEDEAIARALPLTEMASFPATHEMEAAAACTQTASVGASPAIEDFRSELMRLKAREDRLEAMLISVIEENEKLRNVVCAKLGV